MHKYLDGAAVVLLFLAGLGVGAMHVRDTRHAGASPEVTGFHRRVYAAAVMSACGRGLTTPSSAIADGTENRAADRALADFVMQRRESLACSELPDDVQGEGLDGLQKASRYLLLAFATTWRIAGASWPAADWLLGAFFGISIAAAFGLCRVCMPWLGAAAVAALLLLSPLQLEFLPDLRDYSKATFFTLTLLLVAFAVIRVRRPIEVILATAVGGIVAAIGFGMRTDSIINLPVLLGGVGLFLPGAFLTTLRTRLLAVAAGVLAFAIVATPLLSNSETNSSPWHVSLLGFATVWDDALDIAPGPYQLGHFYSDSYVATQIDAFWSRTSPTQEFLSVGLPHYAEASRAYYFSILRTFPADVALRAGAAVIKVLELPFTAKLGLFRPLALWLFVIAVLATSIPSARLALLLCAVVLVLGAYPSIQFQRRHYFHLEIVGLWILGYVVSRVAPNLFSRARRLRSDGIGLTSAEWRRPALFAIAVLALLSMTTTALRASQQKAAGELFGSYRSAAIVGLESITPAQLPQRSMISDMIVAELSPNACPVDRPAIRFSFQGDSGDVDFSQTIEVDLPAGQNVQVFFPVFQRGALNANAALRFGGVEVADSERACVIRLGRFANPDAFPLLLPVVLTQDWRDRPLRQSLRGWETDPYVDPSRPHAYFSPATLKPRGRELVAAVSQAMPLGSAVEYSAPIVRIKQQGPVTFNGRATATSTYLVAWQPQDFESSAVIVIEGRLEHGGLQIGLVDKAWASQVVVTQPGPFRVFLQPPSRGRYQLVVANYLHTGQELNRGEITRLVTGSTPEGR